MNPAKLVRSPKIGRKRAAGSFGGVTINLAPCGRVTVFGVLQTGQVTLTFVSGISAEGSVTLETLKVFMQFVQPWNLSIEVSLPRPAPIFFHVVIDGMTGYGAVGEAKPLYPLNGLCHPAFLL